MAQEYEWIDLPFFDSKKFKEISRFLVEEEKSGKEIYPHRKDILNAFALTPIENVKVVVIGQDPYHTPEMAMGLAFSVPSNTKKIPPSLINIFKEIKSEYGDSVSTDPDLTRWAKQGVLLLNTAFSVERGRAGSHSQIGWNALVMDTLDIINKHKKNVVFLLWGAHAKSFEMYIDKRHHLVLTSAHPSPMSASRGFFGCKHFSKTNDYLISKNLTPISW